MRAPIQGRGQGEQAERRVGYQTAGEPRHGGRVVPKRLAAGEERNTRGVQTRQGFHRPELKGVTRDNSVMDATCQGPLINIIGRFANRAKRQTGVIVERRERRIVALA